MRAIPARSLLTDLQKRCPSAAPRSRHSDCAIGLGLPMLPSPTRPLLCWQNCALAGITDPTWAMGRDPTSSSGNGARIFCILGKVCYRVHWRAGTYLSVAVMRRQRRRSRRGMVGSPGTAESCPCWSHTAAAAPVPSRLGQGAREAREKCGGTVPQLPTAAPAATRQPTGTAGKWSRVSYKLGTMRAGWDTVARLITDELSLQVLLRIYLFVLEL